MSSTERYREALERIRGYAAKSSRQDAPAVLHMIMASVDAALVQDPTPPDNRPELTARQAEVLNFIEQYHAAHGYGPSFREIGEHFGITSPNGVVCHLEALRKKGYLRWNPLKSRTLTVIGGGR